MMRVREVFGRAVVAGALWLTGCASEPGDTLAGSPVDASQGADALHKYGCGACHRIPGIAGADGIVGPPLVEMGKRVYIGRGLPNTPDNMIRWIRSPQALAPGSAMPDMPVTAEDAKAMVAYLYRLR